MSEITVRAHKRGGTRGVRRHWRSDVERMDKEQETIAQAFADEAAAHRAEEETREETTSLIGEVVKEHERGASGYLNERVNYGGEDVSRAEMMRDLQRVAAQRFPDDKQRQHRMVNAYMQGREPVGS